MDYSALNDPANNQFILMVFSVFWIIFIFCFLGPCCVLIHNLQHPESNYPTRKVIRKRSTEMLLTGIAEHHSRQRKFSIGVCYESKIVNYQNINIQLQPTQYYMHSTLLIPGESDFRVNYICDKPNPGKQQMHKTKHLQKTKLKKNVNITYTDVLVYDK